MNRQSERRKEKSDSDSDGGGDAHKCVKRARKSYNGSRKYLESWEKEFPWLISVASGNSKASLLQALPEMSEATPQHADKACTSGTT